MKKWITLLLCLILASCAGWSEMSKEKRVESAVAYYRTFSAGLTMAADIAGAMNPDLGPAIQTAKTTIRIMDAAVNSYSAHQTEEKAAIAYGAAQAANAAVAEIAIPNASEAQIQSFFEGSTRTALGGIRFLLPGLCGIRWNGPGAFCV